MVKFTLERATKTQRGSTCITLSFISALDGVGGQRHAPAASPPGTTRFPFYRRVGRPQDRSGCVRKISPPLGFDPRTVQPVPSRYTDYATQTHMHRRYKRERSFQSTERGIC